MPKLLYLITEDWFFVSHFLPMAREARAMGFEVVVATRVREQAARIAAEGFRVVPLEGERRSVGIAEVVRGFTRIVRIVRAERPDLVHCIALRMVALGGLAARFGGAQRLVLAPTGLGTLWSGDSAVNRAAGIEQPECINPVRSFRERRMRRCMRRQRNLKDRIKSKQP